MPLPIRASSQSRLQELLERTPARGRTVVKAIELVASSLRSQHHLGRPSVGGRLTASAAGVIFPGHGRPEARSVGARNCMASSGVIGVYQSAACLARPQELWALRRAGTLLSMHLLYGSTSIEPGAPAPNPSIERTCLKPLRAFSPAAHVER